MWILALDHSATRLLFSLREKANLVLQAAPVDKRIVSRAEVWADALQFECYDKSAAFLLPCFRRSFDLRLYPEIEASFCFEIEVVESYFGGKRGSSVAGYIPSSGQMERGGKI